MEKYADQFNRVINELCDDLGTAYPQDDFFNFAGALLATYNSISPCTCIEKFYVKVNLLYGDKVLSKDEDFFINHDYKDEINKRPFLDKIISRLQTYWKEMNMEDKETVIKYMTTLIKLAKKYHDIKENIK